METFLNDFRLFFSVIFECISQFFAWFSTNLIGEIILFIVLMTIFVGFIALIVHMKD